MSDIITALKIQEATQRAMRDEFILQMAKDLLSGITNVYDAENINDEHIDLLYEYTSITASAVATYVAEALLGELDFDNMCNEINEFSNMGREVFGE